MVRVAFAALAAIFLLSSVPFAHAQSAAPAAAAAEKPKPAKPKVTKPKPKPPVVDMCPAGYQLIGYFKDGKGPKAKQDNVCGNGENLCVLEKTGETIECEGFTLLPGKSAY